MEVICLMCNSSEDVVIRENGLIECLECGENDIVIRDPEAPTDEALEKRK